MKHNFKGKGILLEVNSKKGFAIVLSPNKDFKKIPLNLLHTSKLEKGKEVEYSIPRSTVHNYAKQAAAAAAVLLIFAGTLYSWWINYRQPIAHVALDFNPSLELQLNRREHIIKAEAYNRQGEELLEKAGDGLESASLEEGVSSIIEEVQQMEYSRTEPGNALMVTLMHREKEEEVKENISLQIHRLLEQALENEEVKYEFLVNEINKNQVDPEIKKEAREVHLNANSMLLMQASKETGSPVSGKEIKEKGPGQVFQQLKEKGGEKPPYLNVGPPETPPGHGGEKPGQLPPAEPGREDRENGEKPQTPPETPPETPPGLEEEGPPGLENGMPGRPGNGPAGEENKDKDGETGDNGHNKEEENKEEHPLEDGEHPGERENRGKEEGPPEEVDPPGSGEESPGKEVGPP